MQHTFESQDSERLSQFLTHCGISRGLTSLLKRTDGGIMVNGAPAHTDYILSPGDTVQINEQPEYTDSITQKDLGVKILYEDNEVIVYDKPNDMPCHPSREHHDDTLANHHAFYTGGMVFHCITRLDRDTTGCCLVAKSRYATNFLKNNVAKKYSLIASGLMEGFRGVIEKPIRRKPGSLIERECADDGKYAKTSFSISLINARYTFCSCTTETGRTHQIRGHFASIGYPLAGDSLYGGDMHDLSHQALHCERIRFITPDDGFTVIVESEQPKEWRKLYHYG